MFSFVKVIKDFTIEKHGSCFFANFRRLDGSIQSGKFISRSLDEVISSINNYYLELIK